MASEHSSETCEICGGRAPCDCTHRVTAFSMLMRHELVLNSEKGGRNGPRGWITASPDALLAEIHDHAAKLHVAAREAARRRSGAEPRPIPWGDDALARTREFAADTANVAMMLLDVLGAL